MVGERITKLDIHRAGETLGTNTIRTRKTEKVEKKDRDKGGMGSATGGTRHMPHHQTVNKKKKRKKKKRERESERESKREKQSTRKIMSGYLLW